MHKGAQLVDDESFSFENDSVPLLYPQIHETRITGSTL